MNFTDEQSEELKNLQSQLAEIDKKIQETRQGAILEARAIMEKYNIKPEELKEKQEEKEETPPV